MASVLTPYRSSDGNNPYTEAQLKALWKDLEPESRAPGKYTPQERILLQREFLAYIQQGFSATRAVQRLQGLALKEPDKWPYIEYATIMAWKAYDSDFSDAYEVAYAMGTDQLEDKAVEMAYGGNANILQFLLKMRNHKRYAPKQEIGVSASGQIDHVHRVEIVAAPSRALEIEDAREQHIAPDMARMSAEDAEVIGDD